MVDESINLFLSYFEEGLDYNEAIERLKQDVPIPGIEVKVPALIIQNYGAGKTLTKETWPEFAFDVLRKLRKN